MIRALHERSGELSRFVPDLNSHATEWSPPDAPVVSRPDGETSPSYPAGEIRGETAAARNA